MRTRAWLLLPALILGLHATGWASPEEAKGRCRIGGEVRAGEEPSASARIEVFLWRENPRHPHGSIRTAEATTVHLLAPPDAARPRAVASTDAKGRFDVRGLTPGRYLVNATAVDGSWGGAYVPLDANGQYQQISIRLHPASESLVGRVRHADGRSAWGFVYVSLEPPLWSFRSLTRLHSLRWARLDDDGRFQVDGLPAGKVWVSAVLPGRFRRTAPPVRLPVDSAFAFVVDAVERPTIGRVLDIDTDEPLAGVRVVWEGEWDGLGPCHGVERTATDGSFLLPAPRGVRSMHARCEGYAERYFKHLRGVGDGTYRLRRGTRVTGRVTAAGTGEPVAGLLVQRRPDSRHYQWTRAVTDEDGRFVLEDQAPGWGRIFARGGGWVPAGLRARSRFAGFDRRAETDPLAWHVPPGSDTSLALEVERGGGIEGRVVDHERRPVAGVPIVETSREDPAFSWTGRDVTALVASAADGTFRIDGLLPGARYALHARPSRAAPTAVGVTLPSGAAPLDTVEIRLPAPHWLRVRVVDAKTKAPLAGAHVELMLSRGRDEREWRTGEDGIARVGPIGKHKGTLDIRADGHIDANQRTAPRPTPEGARVTVALERALTIRGEVLLPDGTPAGDAVVYTSNVSDLPVPGWDHYRGQDSCRADGTFVADRVKARVRYELRAVLWRDGKRYEARTVVPGGTQRAMLTLKPKAKPESQADRPPVAGPTETRPVVLVIRVTDGQGRPVPRARSSGLGSDVVDGRVELTEPLPEDRAIEIWDARSEDDVRLPLGALRVERPPATTGEFTLTLPPEKVLHGRVCGPDGVPVPRVEVAATPVRFGITPPPVPRLESPRSKAVSDPEGRFRLGGLGDEECALWLTLPEGWLVPLRVPRGVPGGAPVEIRLRRAATIVVRVLAPDGQPFEGAEVDASRDGWSYNRRLGWTRGHLQAAEARSDAEGRCVLGGIDPLRRHTIRVEPPSGRDDLTYAMTDVREPGPVTLSLRPQGRISGRIVDGDGVPIGGNDRSLASRTFVLWRQGGPWQDAHCSLKAGVYRARLPAAGEVELAAAQGIMREPLPTTKIVKANVGAEDVDLVLDPGATLPVRFRGWAGEADATCRIAIHREGDAPDAWASAYSQAEGTRLVGLDPNARYLLWVVGAPGGVCGRVDGVEATRGEIVIPLATGLKITGRIRAAEAIWGPTLFVRAVGGGPHIGPQNVDEAFTIEGLTPGPWIVRAHATMGDRTVRAKAEVEAGGTADLLLK